MGYKGGSLWRHSAHIPVLIILQVIFIILFARFVVYNPESAGIYSKNSKASAEDAMKTYPLFQDVHVMIFIGFGFLMTFLKKYGLSAVSLNMLCAVISLQWATLVIGFFHLEYEHEFTLSDGTKMIKQFPGGVIFMDLINSMLLSDFAAASVLISFGAVIGTTTPLQLIVMTLIEIVLFVVNEIIGRKYLGAVDAGDSIFVHAFGAYFGLAVSRVLYNPLSEDNQKQGSGYTSDLFSMVGTIFLWMFWPSFNGAAALAGEAQHRAILNTYFSLCASVVAAFSTSSLLNEHNKFVMEHIQNATLAGGVAIGAVADLLVHPWVALVVGSIAGTLSVIGYQFFTPYLKRNLKIHDTCGVHNLHGMPALLATLLSVIFAGVANEEEYGHGLTQLYPALANQTENGEFVPGISPGKQAANQFFAGVITMVFALVGGVITGFIMKYVGKCQARDPDHRPGSTVIKLVLNVGNVFAGTMGIKQAMPKDAFFDDNLFFEVNADDHVIVEKDDGHGERTEHRFSPEQQMRQIKIDPSA